MKRDSVHISIAQPCHERWDRMDTTEHGAFCHSCQTHVVDFSRMTDREVIEYLSHHKTECGRFRDDQIDTKLSKGIVKKGFLKWKAFLLSLISLATIKSAVAKLPSYGIHSYGSIRKEADDIHARQTDSITVHGTVLDESGNGSADAVIELLDSAGYITDIRSETDSLGHFTLVIATQNNRNYPLQLQVAHWSYRAKTITLTNEAIQHVTIQLKEHFYMKMGKMKLAP